MKALLLASFLLTGSPLLTAGSSPKQTVAIAPATSMQLGSDVVNRVRADYSAGKYSQFLKEMDKSYAEAKGANELTGLIELRAAPATTPPDSFLKGYDAVQSEKSKELLKAIAGQDDSSFVQKVRSAAATLNSAAEEEALKALASLATKAPGTGKTADENKLLDIDLEYAYKSIHLDSLVAGGASIPDRKEKQLVLKMARMDQMAQAASSFEDKALKSQVGLIASHFDARLAKSYDSADLNALARGKIKPGSPLEEKVAAIYLQANDQLAELHVNASNSLMSETSSK